jgi:CDP-6-deoxy-D-xylo-4-hexulose-3-dehydrase
MKEDLAWKRWKKGEWHLMNRIQWDQKELDGVVEVFRNDWFAAGKKVKEFSEGFSGYTGIKYVNLTNSGSAAIETALLALKHDGRWQQGDRVLHPATTFATSISSAINLGLAPLYVETKPNTYVADPERVEMAVRAHPEVRGMILPHLIGNISDMGRIKKVLEDRFLIEDCCDTLGGTYGGKHIGSFGDIGAFSFYASHHITAGGVGGAVATNNERLGRLIKSIIHWGRDFSPADEMFLKRYTYETRGLDAQMTEIQAAFASAQLSRLPGIVEARAEQFTEMTALLKEQGFFHLPETFSGAKPSWFAYPLTIKQDAPFTRSEFARYLTAKQVEIRPLMCGNITRQIPFDNNSPRERFPIGDSVEFSSLFIPCWGMPKDQREDYHSILRTYLSGDYKNSLDVPATKRE